MATESLVFDILARDRASKTFDKMGKSVDKTAHRFDRFKVAAAGFGVAFGAMALKVGKDSVKAFTEAEESQAKLEDAFARFPAVASVNIEYLRELNSELAKKTTFDDDAIASGQAVLAQFKLTGDQIADLTPTLVDFAAKTGRDIPTSAKLLGKAFLGNTRALKDLGINYKMTGNRQKDMANITDLVQQKTAGFAETMGKTATGQAKILQNQFGELEEKIGGALVPALLKLADVGLKVIGFIQRNAAVIGPLAAAFTVVVGAIKAWTIAQAALNVVMALNPIGLVVIAIAALVAGIVIAYKKSETFRDIVKAGLKVVALAFLKLAEVALKVLRFMINAWLSYVNVLVQGAAKAFGWIPGLGPKLKGAARAFEKFKDSLIGSLDKSIDKVEELQDRIRGIKSKTVTITVNASLQAVGGDWARLRGLEGRQHGGSVRMGRAYRVGEAGPEVFVPNRNGTIVPNGAGAGGGPIVLEVIGGDKELTALIRRMVKIKGGGDVQKAFGT